MSHILQNRLEWMGAAGRSGGEVKGRTSDMQGEDRASPVRMKMIVFSVSLDGNAFHVRKLKTGVVLEHTLCSPYP